MISVIVPVYNIENYIERCIQSVITQTFTDFELLLINDGSTDQSGEICQKCGVLDSRIRYISKENGGVSSTRNLGLDLAKGEYIFFLDGDDWLHPECLEKMYEKMTPETDLVISEWEEPVDGDFKALLITKKKNFEGIVSKSEIFRDIYDGLFYPKVLWGKLYRKELWQGIRLKQDMIYSEDTYAMLEVLERARALYSIQKPFYYYLQRSSGVSQKRTIRNHADYMKTLDFKYEKACRAYPEFREISGIEYIREGYILLELLNRAKEKKQALCLIEKMKQVYRTAGIRRPMFSQKILLLPKQLMYLWIDIRKYLKKVAD